METTTPRRLIEIMYWNEAQDYLRSLPLEHFMEATPQATQRKITLESLDLVQARRPDVQPFNELLVQYPIPGERKPGKVVPDNMVVLWHEKIEAETSYDVPFQPVGPFWVLEYVSKNTRRKDYNDNFDKYEKYLHVPYFLLFYPEIQDLTLYRFKDQKYVTVLPNDQGRYPLPELEIEVAILGEWVRFWFRGELLPLPAELQAMLDETRLRWEEEKHRADVEQQRADEQQRRADRAEQQAEQERNARLALEQELEQLRTQLRQSQGP